MDGLKRLLGVWILVYSLQCLVLETEFVCSSVCDRQQQR